MNLVNNELIYDQEDTPKTFSLADWRFLVPVLKAVSPKITDVEQRGVYGDEPRRFSLVVSEELTEQEQEDVLTAWSSFDSAILRLKEKKLAVEEQRIALGIKTKAYMGYLCEEAEMTIDAYENLLTDELLTKLDRLLLSGALETCYGLLGLYTPTSYFPQTFKDKLMAELTKHIATVNALDVSTMY